MAETETRGGEKRKIVTNKERERRLKAAKRKKLILRIVFIIASVLILAALVFLTVTLVKAIKKLADGSSGASKYYCSTYQLENAGDADVVTIGETFFILRDSTLMCAADSGSLLWTEELGEGNFKIEAFGDGAVVYAVRGTGVMCFDQSGLKWEKREDAPIAFVVLGNESGTCLICTEPEDCSSRIVYFETKSQKTVSEMLLEKKYTSNHVISAAISPGGKSIAVAEIAESGETAATRLSVIDVLSGKSFFSKMIENEICPFCAFAGDTNLVSAGRKNVYVVEKIDRNNARSARFSTLLALGDAGNDVECALTVKKHLMVSVGNGDGKSDVKIYDLENGGERSLSVPRNVKGFLPCGNDAFVCYTQSDFTVHDFEGNKLSSCEEKLDIDYISADGNLHFALRGIYGTILVDVKKAG
ncbi:MAG: hypothetical protein J6112_04555 [Clostridia bacterium]|nr:hypothetical protein [Clostridia bacterium]